jgi:Copper amine oxidase N-terminal domain
LSICYLVYCNFAKFFCKKANVGLNKLRPNLFEPLSMRNPLRSFLASLCLLSNALPSSAQSVPDGPKTRDITTLLVAELKRDCKQIVSAAIVAIPNCTVAAIRTAESPVRVLVNGLPVQASIPPLLIDVPGLGGKMFVEMSSLFTSLGYAVSWNSTTQTVSAKRNDYVVQMTLGQHRVYRSVNGLPANELWIEPGLAPFLATSSATSATNRVLIPLAAVAEVTGSDVQWEPKPLPANYRTAIVTRGSAYFYERQADGSGTDIMHTEFTYVPVDASGTAQRNCPAPQVFDWSARFCADPLAQANRQVYGNFPASYRARAQALGMASALAQSNAWPEAQFLRVADSVGLSGRSTEAVLSEMEANLEVFGMPFDNHDISTPGMFSVTGGSFNSFTRSETVLPPFIMSGRRQTDQMVRNLYAMLPESVRSTTAFLMPDRVAQNPRAYLDYIRSKQRVVLIGSFKGARSIDAVGSNASALMQRQYQAMQTRQHRELFKLRTTLALLESMKIPVINVFYAMGDSKTGFALTVRDTLQTRLNQVLQAAGLANLVSNGSSTLTWGADELAAVAFAKLLPERKVYIEASNMSAKHVWDALFTTQKIIDEKLPTLNLKRVATPAEADIEVQILNREPGVFARYERGEVGEGALAYPPESAAQAEFDAQALHDELFVQKLRGFDAARRARTVIIDARVPNGAWDAKASTASTDWLVFSAWGTFANNFALAVAQAKVLHHARTVGAAGGIPTNINVAANARRMYLEAVAHDVYANGYLHGQRGRANDGVTSFKERLSSAGLSFVHQQGYSASATYSVFKILNTHVNEAMKRQFSSLPTNQSFQVNAQFWRTFESEVHLYPVPAGEILTPGLHRLTAAGIPGTTAPMTEVLSPLHRATASDQVVRVTLKSLLGLEPGVR